MRQFCWTRRRVKSHVCNRNLIQMDAYDLFRQLTRGARFKRKLSAAAPAASTNVNVTVNVENNKPTEIKFEDEQTPSECSEPNDDEFKIFHDDDDDEQPSEKKKARKAKTKTATEGLLKQQHDAEVLAHIRKENRITVMGSNIPPPITSFDELQEKFNVSDNLVKNITAHFQVPTPIQMQSIPIMLKGRPLMACAPTGSGKTVAFLTPIINDLRSPKKIGFRAIVLAPTRELAQQIYRECVRLSEKTALRIHFISKISQRVEQMFAPGNGNSGGGRKCDILISTPNRVRYLLQQDPPKLDLSKVEWFVIDEADRLLEEGQNNFKDQLDDILSACTNSSKKLALFSATYTVPVAKWALRNLKHLARVTIGQQNTATNAVDQELLFVGSESGKLLAIRDLVRTGLKPPVLIFVQSKDRAKQLFDELLYDGINVDVIHADRTQQQRDNCVRAFREGNIWVLICTELMGRGIDFKGVNLVINYDFPQSTIAYIHRIGRTGRAGRRGKAITYFTEDDKTNLRSIAQIIKNAGGKVPDFALTMKKARKTERKRLEMMAPKRGDISTKIRPQLDSQEAPQQQNNNGKQFKSQSKLKSKVTAGLHKDAKKTRT